MSDESFNILLMSGLFNWTFLDTASTVISVKYYDAYEANLIGRYMIENHGLIEGLVIIKSVAFVLLLFLFYILDSYDVKMSKYAQWYLAIFIFVVGTSVSVNNLANIFV